jgi:hypothetical protein
MLEPSIVYRNKSNNKFVEDNFRAAKSENIDKNDPSETYANLLSKHMGDFLNGVNSIHNNIVFASGDSLACVGYLITVALIPGAISRLLWEDATNDQIWLVSTTGTDVDHFRKTVSTAVEVPSDLPVEPMTLPTDVIEDDYLNGKLKEEMRIFEGLNNINLGRLPNLGRLDRYNNFQYQIPNSSNVRYNMEREINRMAEAPARIPNLRR